ncbi:MAG: DNA mismatch repair protein MutS [Clostridia bacterium]|nr:DNA mismatch repair protein MutS [Clostridia bacterium]
MINHAWEINKGKYASQVLGLSSPREKEIIGLLNQYDQMKSKHPDAVLLFRVKDTYQSFREDALKSQQILDLPVKSENIKGQSVPTTSFPHHALDTYLPKLVRAGQRVAICEQLEDPKIRKKEETDRKVTELVSPAGKPIQQPINSPEMPRKKKEEAVVEAPKPTKEQKVEQKNEQTQETKTERQQRPPQMVTANGDKVTHGHAFQSTKNPEEWYFTAKLNGEQLKPQKMDPADLAAYKNKEISVQSLMWKYYPSKIMPKYNEEVFKAPYLPTGEKGEYKNIEKFNVYKEKNPEHEDYGKYKFYAKVDGIQMSTVASKEDLNHYFDRTMTASQLVLKNFGDRLHLKSHYEEFKTPMAIKESDFGRVTKDRNDGKWYVSADLGEMGKTSKKEISFDDGYSLFKTKTATRDQLALKYLDAEIWEKIKVSENQKQEKNKSLKM